MKNMETHQPEFTELRKQAEKTLKKKSDESHDPSELSLEETHRLIHELQVQQIELEMQNEELRSIQQELKTSRDKYSNLYDHAPIGYFTINGKGVILGANLTGANLLGPARNKLMGQPFYNFVTGNTEDVFYLFLQELLDTGEPQACELKLIKMDDAQFHAHLESRVVHDDDGNFSRILMAVTDITKRKQNENERKDLEKRLQQAHKMETIGTLTGGIAHDFNNILSIILGNAELTMDDIPEGHPAQNSLGEIETASLRAKNTVKQLLTFSRKSDPQRKPVEIVPIIEDALKFLRSSIPINIDIRKTIPDESWVVSADPTQINQVIMNLCINAAHAMSEDGGIIDISCSFVEFDNNGAVYDFELNQTRYVKITVLDTGHGIEKEHLDRIFDPYFTTKEVGEGSGFGLSVVHGIVKSHNGAISVDSEYGEGTMFNIFLPIVEKASESEKGFDAVTPTGSERILFVDDEETIVHLTRMMLERLGYTVTAKICSRDALETFQNQPEDFDLIITDMTMPSIMGDRLVKDFRKIRPDIPIILCTGFSERINDEKARYLGVQALVMKPVQKNAFAKIIRRVLDEKLKH